MLTIQLPDKVLYINIANILYVEETKINNETYKLIFHLKDEKLELNVSEEIYPDLILNLIRGGNRKC